MFFSTHNFKGYKKTKEDGKSATLKHPDGHHITIAIAALKPEHKKALKDLPLHFDEGGEVDDNIEEHEAPKPEESSAPQVGTAPAVDSSTPSFGSDAAAGAMAAGPKGGGGGGGGGMAAMMGAEGGEASDDEPPIVRAENLLSQDRNQSEPASSPLMGMVKQAIDEHLHKALAPQGNPRTVQPGGIMRSLPGQPLPQDANMPVQPPSEQQQPAPTQAENQAADALIPKESSVDAPQSAVQDMPNPDVTPQSLGSAASNKASQEEMAANLSPDAQKRAQLQQYAAEDQAWSRDLTNGHVQAKTYGDLFNNKSTLGKIGMMFGMMLSGAGSGLAHQPNAMLDMMNKEIDRDYNAQVQSKNNAMNFVKMNQEHQMQIAQINQMKRQGKLTDAQARSMTIDSNIKAQTNARMQMNRVALHHMVTQVQRMPEGPQKQQAMQTLGMVSSAVDAENFNLADVAASKAAFMNMSSNMANPGQGQGAVDFNRMNQLERAAQMKMPGAPSEADIGAMGKEATQVEENRALQRTFNDSFDKLDKMFGAGKLSPHMRAAEINTLSAQMARQTAHRYNLAEAAQQADGMFPQAGDWPSTREEKRRKANQFFASEEAGTPTLDRFGLKRPMGGAQSEGASKPQLFERKGYPGTLWSKGPQGWQRVK